MKKTFTLVFFCFVFLTTDNLYSQGLSIGAYSGVNISDIHGNNSYGKWRFMTGPVQGIFADYNLKRWIGFSTGVRYLSIYYEHRDYNSGYYYPVYGPSSSYWDPFRSSLIWQPYPVKYDFSMLNIPLQAKLTISSNPDLFIAAGTYWSFTTGKPENIDGGKKDFGYIFNAGISAPLGEVFKGNLSAGYCTGRKEFMSLKHGFYEVSLGIAYTGFLKKKPLMEKLDTTSGIKLLYFAGVNVAWNGKGSYGENPGVKAGFMIDIPIGHTVAFRTGLSFEQTGYSLMDSTDYYFAVQSDHKASYYADTKVTIDYIFIPATFKFDIGKKSPFHVNFGPYAALKLNARVTGEAYSVLNNGSTYTRTKISVFDDITSFFDGNDFGLTAGAGINLPFFGKYRSEAGVLYRAGLKNVFETGANQQYSGIEVMNRSLAFHFGIIIPVKK